MSECVVRMEMPEDCFECPFGIIDDTEDGVWCNALAQQSSGQREDCPIICSIPEGHGRLVDADALNRKKKYLIKTENGVFPKSEWFIKANDLFAAKTIVPAERSKT